MASALIPRSPFRSDLSHEYHRGHLEFRSQMSNGGFYRDQQIAEGDSGGELKEMRLRRKEENVGDPSPAQARAGSARLLQERRLG